MTFLKKFIGYLREDESGQGLAEYALILALVVVVVTGSVSSVGGSVGRSFDKVVKATDSDYPNYIAKLYSGEEIDEKINTANYIPVSSAEDLQNVSRGEIDIFGKGTKWEGTYRSDSNKKYIQIADIDLNGFGNFEPIGHTNTSNSFKGSFDGGGYVIDNLTINKGSDNYVGLFGYVESATFNNISLDNVDIRGDSWVGGLIGNQRNSSQVTNSYVTGRVKASGYYIGGLVGRQDTLSTISDSYFSGTVEGLDYVGGLVGRQTVSSKVLKSYARGTVTGNHHVGGLIGDQRSNAYIEKSYATCKVSGNQNIGGLVGFQDSSAISNGYSTGKVTGTGEVGGFIGYDRDSSIKDSGWSNDVNSELDGIGYTINGSLSNLVGRTKVEIEAIIKTIYK